MSKVDIRIGLMIAVIGPVSWLAVARTNDILNQLGNGLFWAWIIGWPFIVKSDPAPKVFKFVAYGLAAIIAMLIGFGIASSGPTQLDEMAAMGNLLFPVLVFGSVVVGWSCSFSKAKQLQQLRQRAFPVVMPSGTPPPIGRDMPDKEISDAKSKG